MSTLHIEPFYDPRTSTLTYVVFDEATRDAVVIDPVLDYDPATGRRGPSRSTASRATSSASGCGCTTCSRRTRTPTTSRARSCSGASSTRRSRSASASARSRRRSSRSSICRPSFATDGSQFDRLLRDGETVRAGTLAIEVIATPGHTPACVTYQIGDALFTGDALFIEDYGTGRCDFPRGSADDALRLGPAPLRAARRDARVRRPRLPAGRPRGPLGDHDRRVEGAQPAAVGDDDEGRVRRAAPGARRARSPRRACCSRACRSTSTPAGCRRRTPTASATSSSRSTCCGRPAAPASRASPPRDPAPP